MDNTGIVEYALSGANRADLSEPEEITVKFNKRTNQKMCDLVRVLGTSVEYLLNIATRYALNVAVARRTPVAELAEFPKREGTFPYSFCMTMDTEDRVKQAVLPKSRFSKCAACGILLLHRKLIEEIAR